MSSANQMTPADSADERPAPNKAHHAHTARSDLKEMSAPDPAPNRPGVFAYLCLKQAILSSICGPPAHPPIAQPGPPIRAPRPAPTYQLSNFYVCNSERWITVRCAVCTWMRVLSCRPPRSPPTSNPHRPLPPLLRWKLSLSLYAARRREDVSIDGFLQIIR